MINITTIAIIIHVVLLVPSPVTFSPVVVSSPGTCSSGGISLAPANLVVITSALLSSIFTNLTLISLIPSPVTSTSLLSPTFN